MREHPTFTHDMTRREAIAAGTAAIAWALVPRALRAQPGWHDGVPAPSADVDVAVRAARWVRTARVETPNGITWPADPLNPKSVEYDLYNGMPGVVLFHLELFHATGDRSYLDEARAGANELIAQLPALDAAENAGLYTGLAGAAFVLEETHRASGDGRYRDAAKRAVSMIAARAQKTPSGVAWTRESATNDIISGSAGIGLFLLWAAKHIGDADSTALAAAAARHLVDVGIPANGGTKWAVAPTVKSLYPNFSHGTAGVGYFLAAAHQATGERAFLDAALSGAAYLRAVATTDGDGFKVFHHEPGGEQLYYLSWCHGPAGTSRLFYRLGEITRDEQWHALIRRSARATIDMGVPEQRSPGFWNNISQCCGNCGVGEYFIALDRVMRDAKWREMTSRVAADTMRRSTAIDTPTGPGLKWIQAENRVSPDQVVAQTGFMQGASGVGTFFLHLDAASRGKAPPIVWPDSPYA